MFDRIDNPLTKINKTGHVGDAAEMEVGAYFRRKGWHVLFPFGNCPYDMIVDFHTELARIEVKSTLNRGHVCRGGKAWGWTANVDTLRSFDYLFVHTPESGFMIPHDVLTNGGEFVRKSITVPSLDDIKNGSGSRFLTHLVDDFYY